MITFFKQISRVAETGSAWLLAAITIIVALQVLFRYVLGVIAPWTEELARYTSIWMVYTGVIVATVRADHIKVTVLIDRFGPCLQLASEILAVIIGLFVSIIVFIGGIRLINLSWHRMAVTIPVSVAVLYLPLVLFSMLSLLALSARVIEILSGGLEAKGKFRWK